MVKKQIKNIFKFLLVMPNFCLTWLTKYVII